MPKEFYHNSRRASPGDPTSKMTRGALRKLVEAMARTLNDQQSQISTFCMIAAAIRGDYSIVECATACNMTEHNFRLAMQISEGEAREMFANIPRRMNPEPVIEEPKPPIILPEQF